MKNRNILLILVLAFVLLLGGAYVLYDGLRPAATPDPVAIQTQQAQTDGAAPEDETAGTERNPAADFTVYDPDGGEVHLSDFMGKPIVLNFWASWCGPCKMEMPDFEEKYQEVGEDVQFLMINRTDGARETLDTAMDFLAEQAYTFPVFYDTDIDAGRAYEIYSLPTTFFIDAEGEIVLKTIGTISPETLQRGIDMIFQPVN